VIRGILAFAAAAALACGCQPLSSSPPVQTPPVVSPVDGVVVSVDAAGLADVRGFVLRVSGGFAFDFVLGPLENPTEFPPGHLTEHLATSQPVRVYFLAQGGERVVYRLEDAAPSPAPS
jgi:hypothetical protein